MPAILNTNMASLYAQKNLSTAQADLASSVQKLSSGKRINSAKDDAAGYAVAEAVKATKNVTDQSIQNVQDAISLVQTAEGALDVVGKILQRALTLTTQKENGSLTATQINSITSEISSLFSEVASIQSRTKFQGGGSSIFEQGTLSFTTGENTTTSIPFSNLSLVDLFSNTQNTLVSSFGSKDSVAANEFTTAANHGYSTGDQVIYKSVSSTNEVGNLDENSIYYVIKTADNKFKLSETYEGAVAASPTVKAVVAAGTNQADNFIKVNSSSLLSAVSTNITNRADLGTWQTRLNYIVDNMQTLSNNLADAQSRIIDTDYASETAKLTRGQILQQAATSMLAQANQMPNVILTLLK